MAKLKLRTTILSKLSTLTRSEGNLVITRDGESLYFDTDSKRFRISDFIDIADDNDRLAILAPNTEKMYYVLSTDAVWRYISGSWHEVTSTEDIYDILTAISGKADSNKAYLTDDSPETEMADDDYVPFYDTSASTKKKSTFSNLVAKIKAKLITDTYSGTSTNGMSGKAVKSAIDALNGGTIGNPSTSKTITALSQTNGNISATFGNISISKTQAGLGFVDNTSDAEKKINFTGSIASGNTGFTTGGDVYTALQGKADTSDIPTDFVKASTGGTFNGNITVAKSHTATTDNQTILTVGNNKTSTGKSSGALKLFSEQGTGKFIRLFNDNTLTGSSGDRRYKLPVDKPNDSELAVVADIPTQASDIGALPSTTTYAGSSSVGGAATSALKADKLSNTSKIGDTNKPVYFKADGTPAAISYTIDKSVPSDAVFTDTTYSFTDGTNQFTVTPSSGSASTIKVTPQLKIDGITSDTTDKEINCYGECSTIASTAAKTVSITKGTFALTAGSKVIVKFTNANTANNPTLNVNSKGAKNIFHNGARITTGANKALLAGTVEFVYDGTQFQLVGNYINTEYTAASSAPGKVASSSSTGTSTNYARQDHTHGIDLATGDANGQVKIAGTNVDVKGLGSNAYTSTSYLPLAGGRLTGNLYNKSALGNVDATANDNGISDTVYSGTIEGQDKNNRRITRLETSAYANGDICFGMNIRQWYMDTSGATPTAKQKATKGFKLTMNKAGTLSALLDGDSNADWFVGKNGLVVGNINSNYAQLTLDSGVSGDVFLTTPSSNGKLAITSDLGSYNKQVGTCNLMRYPSQHTSKSQNGLIFLDNGDGSVTVTGTATANTTYYFAVRGNNIWQVILSAGTYMLIGCPSGGSSSTYSIYCNTYIDGTTTASSGVRDTGSGATVTYDYDVSMGCYIDIKKNTAFPTNGVVFRPQIIPFGVYNFDDYIIGAPYAQTNRQLTITKADYSQIATYENTQNASRAYAKNELMIWRGALYRVTTAISSGSTISTSNVTATTLSAEIKTIRDALNI